MIKNRKTGRISYNVRITENEDLIIKKLRETYCVNVSQFLRKAINNLYRQLGGDNGQK